jgi:hypothetical protein
LGKVKKELTIGTKKAKIQADTIVLYRFVEFDEGNSSIQGKVVRDLPDDYRPPNAPDDFDPANNVVQDIEIFLTIDGDAEILERMRTDANGEFKFSHLIPASYRVYTLSSTIDFVPQDVVGKTVEITGNNQNIILEEPFRVSKK